MAVTFVPRVFGGTLILTVAPPLTGGPVVTLLTDQLVSVARLTDAPRAAVQLNDSQVATATLSEKVV